MSNKVNRANARDAIVATLVMAMSIRSPVFESLSLAPWPAWAWRLARGGSFDEPDLAFARMANVAPFVEINRILSNVGRMIGNPLQALGNDHEIETTRRFYRRPHDVLRQVLLHLLV